MPVQQIYTLREFALRYRVSSATVHKAIRNRQIYAVTLGSELRIPDPGWKIMRIYAERALHMEYFIRSSEIRRLLNISKTRIDQFIERGDLTPKLENGIRYFTLADVIRCANKRQLYFDNSKPQGGAIKKGSRAKTHRKLVVDWAIAEARDLFGTTLGPEQPQDYGEHLRRQQQASEVWLMPSGD